MKGIFYLSFDVEFEYGRKHLKNYPDFIPRIKNEEMIIKRLLLLLKKYHIKATFAVVGRLFEERLEIIKLIKDHGHEIASHSLTHPDFKKITRKQAEYEIKMCVALAKKEGLSLKSFVFPFNRIAHLDLLKKYGFTSFRGLKTTYFPSTRRLGKFIPKGWRFKLTKLGIDKAVKDGRVFHLWTHPIDFTDNTRELFLEFENILRYISILKKSDRIEIKVMREVSYHNL